MKRSYVAAIGLILFAAMLLFDDSVVGTAEAGVLTRNNKRITSRLRRRPRMQLAVRYPSSSSVIKKTNPPLKSGDKSLTPEKQIDAQQSAEEDYRKKYTKWRTKQIKVQQKYIQKEKKEQATRIAKAKKQRESELRKAKKNQSIKEAPLNPGFGSKSAKDGTTIDLHKGEPQKGTEGEKSAPPADKSKDGTRRVPLLKQLWHAIFG